MVRLQRHPLTVDEAYASVVEGNVGAISIFVGTTRRHTAEKGETVRLEYDCYEAMALAEMSRISEEAMRDWTLERLFMAHRLGPVPVGESSVVIAVSSSHRRESMQACQFLIDTLKVVVPIWKKEVYADGATEWVKGTVRPSRDT